MSGKKPSAKTIKKATQLNETALTHYAEWEIDEAIVALQEAVKLDPANPEYHLNLARCWARASSFHDAMQSLGEFLANETDEALTERYQQMFSTALDKVETILIEKMRGLDADVQQIGKAIQMWLEYRITLGRQTLDLKKPVEWAAALNFTIFKINLDEVRLSRISKAYGIKESALRKRYNQLVEVLDLMPGDYRYFTGEENPLDQLVDAAQTLDDIYNQFKED